MILPVILSGGAGSRLWPLSTADQPKQLLALMGERTMIQQTADRLAGEIFRPPAVICNAAHAETVAAQLPEAGAILLEPVGRNTAPAAAAAALHGLATGAELVLLVPADHHIADPDAFRAAVAAAAPVAREGRIVTFGIQPDRPETGYGYIRMAEAVHGEVRRVDAFVEKPDRPTAEGYLASGDYAWNAGMFLFAPQTLIAELRTHVPDILSAVETAMSRATRDGRLVHIDPESFATSPAESVDYAVMERTAHMACLATEMGWSDIGSFASLHGARARDAHGNAVPADAMVVDSRGCLVVTEGEPAPRVSLVGVEGVGVIVRDGEIMVVDLDRAQDVKRVVERLKAGKG